MLNFVMIGWIFSPFSFQNVDVYGNPNAYVHPELTIGDQPPPLKVGKWMRGTPLTQFEKGKVYLVEFWASWCNPCQKSVPHLNKLQEKYRRKGVQVVAVAANEAHGHGEAKGSAPLELFLKRRGRTIDYTVGYTANEKIYREWVEAARLSGLPWVFIIDRQGRIAWIGQPFHDGFEQALSQVVAQTHPLEQWKRRHEIRQGERIKGWDLAEQFWKAMDEKDWKSALRHSRTLKRMDGDWFYYEAAMAFELMWSRLNQKDQAMVFAKEAQAGFLNSKPEGLAALAELILSDKNLTDPQVKLAFELAQHAVTLTRAEDPSSLLLLAKAEAIRGDADLAMTRLEKALPLADASLGKKILEEKNRLEKQRPPNEK